MNIWKQISGKNLGFPSPEKSSWDKQVVGMARRWLTLLGGKEAVKLSTFLLALLSMIWYCILLTGMYLSHEGWQTPQIVLFSIYASSAVLHYQPDTKADDSPTSFTTTKHTLTALGRHGSLGKPTKLHTTTAPSSIWLLKLEPVQTAGVQSTEWW